MNGAFDKSPPSGGNNKEKDKMKNKGKKSKRVNIECVDDLIDALVDIEDNVNDKLYDLGVKQAVKVEQGVGLVNIKIDDKVMFSMNVTDASASSAFGALKSAIDRAKKSLMPKEESAKVVVDELPAPAERPAKNDMTEEKFRAELDKLAEMANERLVEHLGAEKIAGVVINFTFDGTDTIVRSGDTELVTLHGHAFGAVKKAKSVVWPKVDELKSGKGKSGSVKPGNANRGGSFSERLDEIVKSANDKLAEIGEEPISVTSDSVGVYVSEGKLPICSIPKGVGSADDALEKVKAQIWEFVDAVRGVVDRRKHDVQRAKELEADSAWDMAILEKANPGIDKSELWKLGPNADAASAIVEAAKKAVKSFNASLRFKFDGLDDILGENEERKMSVRGFTRGIVVSFGDDPCFISMFPLVGNNSSVDETAAYVGSHIASIGESRMKYYAGLVEEHNRQNKMRELAAKKDALESEIAAMAM